MRDVRNVNPQVVIAVWQLPCHHGVVQVFGFNAVNRHQGLIGQVAAANFFFRLHRQRNRVGLVHYFLGKFVGHIVSVDH